LCLCRSYFRPQPSKIALCHRHLCAFDGQGNCAGGTPETKKSGVGLASPVLRKLCRDFEVWACSAIWALELADRPWQSRFEWLLN
jgi:hypothetical protein